VEVAQGQPQRVWRLMQLHAAIKRSALPDGSPLWRKLVCWPLVVLAYVGVFLASAIFLLPIRLVKAFTSSEVALIAIGAAIWLIVGWLLVRVTQHVLAQRKAGIVDVDRVVFGAGCLMWLGIAPFIAKHL
jgi:hypothetical protein